jgi:gas vesicle protein GvpK
VGKSSARRSDVAQVTKAELESLRRELDRASGAGPARWNADPDDVQRSVARLVLALVEFLRKLMERQAIRRMEAETLDAEQIEAMGLALMRLEETVRDIAARFGLQPDELNLDLGPLGKLM